MNWPLEMWHVYFYDTSIHQMCQLFKVVCFWKFIMVNVEQLRHTKITQWEMPKQQSEWEALLKTNVTKPRKKFCGPIAEMNRQHSAAYFALIEKRRWKRYNVNNLIKMILNGINGNKMSFKTKKEMLINIEFEVFCMRLNTTTRDVHFFDQYCTSLLHSRVNLKKMDVANMIWFRPRFESHWDR